SGTDAAFLLACIHVILKEFYVDRRAAYFQDYVKRYTNLPFLVMLEPDSEGRYRQGRFLRASDVAGHEGEEHLEWKLLMMDAADAKLRLPPGTIGFRWQKQQGKWNLKTEDAGTAEPFDPVLTLMDLEHEQVQVLFSDFTHTFDTTLGTTDGKGRKAKAVCRAVP